jgi:hypothetical protein
MVLAMYGPGFVSCASANAGSMPEWVMLPFSRTLAPVMGWHPFSCRAVLLRSPTQRPGGWVFPARCRGQCHGKPGTIKRCSAVMGLVPGAATPSQGRFGYHRRQNRGQGGLDLARQAKARRSTELNGRFLPASIEGSTARSSGIAIHPCVIRVDLRWSQALRDQGSLSCFQRPDASYNKYPTLPTMTAIINVATG